MTTAKYERLDTQVENISSGKWFNNPHPLGWGLLNQFPTVCSFLSFQSYQHRGYLLNIIFISDRCHCIVGAATPVRCECDLNDLTSTLAKSKFSQAEKLTKGTLITPTPGQLKVIIPCVCLISNHELLASRIPYVFLCELYWDETLLTLKLIPWTWWMLNQCTHDW